MSRRHKKKHHDDHEEHPSEAWLIALADMMTLLMVTFLMMFAISVLDLKKFQTFKEGFSQGTGTSLPALPGAGVPAVGDVYEEPVAPKDGAAEVEVRPTTPPAAEVLDEAELKELQKKLQQQLEENGLSPMVEAKYVAGRGLVVYVTDGVLFESGQADVTRTGDALVDGLGLVLAGFDNPLVVEGHTDKRPISTDRFPNNWYLSVHRAVAVAERMMQESDIPASRLTTTGYGDTRPREDRATAEAYAANRRVEIVVELPEGS